MTDQVNPLGSLAPGMPQTLQAAASLPSKPPPAKPVEPKAASRGERADVVSKEDLEAAAKDVQDYFQQTPVDIKFAVDHDTGTIYFKLINPATGEVVRQVPSEEILTMARKLREISKTQGASGVLMDKEG